MSIRQRSLDCHIVPNKSLASNHLGDNFTSCTAQDPIYLQLLSGIFSVINASPIIFTSSHRSWSPSLSTGETRRRLPDSELLYPVIVYEISYAHDVSWFLDNSELNWTPPRNLVDFIAKARYDKKALVYIGFGSITVPNPKLVTARLIRAVQKSMPP